MTYAPGLERNVQNYERSVHSELDKTASACIGGRKELKAAPGAVKMQQLGVQERRTLAMGLRHAIEHQDTFVQFQPVIYLNDLRVAGHEALLRWTGSDGVGVSSTVLVDIAEETGLIGQLTETVLTQS